MTMLQLLAARLAGVERLVYHTFDGAGSEAWLEGERHGRALVAAGGTSPIEEVIRAVHAIGFQWGSRTGTD